MMKSYKNLAGNSGVKNYDIKTKSIIIEFDEGERYLYDYSQPGPATVERMKLLAKAGKGLSTYISTHVKDHYAKKL